MTKNTPASPGTSPARNKTRAVDPEAVTAINQMFAEFELVFHNQYQKAFSTREKEDWAKKLWYNNLKDYAAAQILDAAHQAIKESEFLPTVRGVLKYLERNALIASGVPDVRDAYREACSAPHPKASFAWSHPAVYHAGQHCGWLFLDSSPEKTSWPVFQQHYKTMCDRVRDGEVFEVPVLPALPEEAPHKTMTKTARQQALAKLRAKTHL